MYIVCEDKDPQSEIYLNIHINLFLSHNYTKLFFSLVQSKYEFLQKWILYFVPWLKTIIRTYLINRRVLIQSCLTSIEAMIYQVSFCSLNFFYIISNFLQAESLRFSVKFSCCARHSSA